jgi:glycine/D-amino acid oxidase-like deaminating enzyme
VTLRAGSTAWLSRPVGEKALVLGQKSTGARIDKAAGELKAWCEAELGAVDVELGRLAIDPSDHGRPVVGASAIPGGFYARGNGRGELMNGTASGWYLAELMTDGPDATLPPISRLRAFGARALRR